jgi:hypothetical protein
VKLMLEDLTGKRLHLDLEYLAGTYGLRGLADAKVYDTDEGLLARLEDDTELGGEG